MAPASEQTWYNQKLLHVVFGLASLVMLIATIWMFAKDHTREWKDYQKTQRKVDQFYLQGRISEARTAEHVEKITQATTELAIARAAKIDAKLLEQFQQIVLAAPEGIEKPDDSFWEEIGQQNQDLDGLSKAAASARKEKDAAESKAADEAAASARAELVAELDGLITEAKLREDNLAREKKFRAADLTSAISLRDIAVGAHDKQRSAERQAAVDRLKEVVSQATADLEESEGYRQKLLSLLKGSGGITATQDASQKKLTEAMGELDRMHASVEGGWQKTGRAILGAPILDAFDNSDTRIEQVWLPEMTINYNFSDVARFDRCITCHRAIDKTGPGSAIEPAYQHEGSPFIVTLATPESRPELPPGEDRWNEALRKTYGLELNEEGLIEPGNVVISAVLPNSAAAEAGLELGDVIERVGGTPSLTKQRAVAGLLGGVRWGESIELTIRRGLPHPYASHPRLDLFVGSTSPHKIGDVGCTICHDGQGSATEFKWASHTPNDPNEAEAWRREHGWFDNHHWIFPMYPDRFIESGCLKCHHEIVELEPSERFPEPPAEKLVQGYHLVRQYGCFGCHEINGFDGPSRRIGPDLRAEPSFHAAAHALLEEDALSPPERQWAERLIVHPEDDVTRGKLFAVIASDKARASQAQTDEAPRFSGVTHKLGELLKDVESPGKYRKTGPSLRFVASKSDYAFLYNWIRKPSDFRPSTRMPQFFGHNEHLEPGDIAERYEPIEIRAITEYLLSASRPFEYLRMPKGYRPSAERGKKLFQTQGCLACHTKTGFEGIEADFGPDLSEIAAKFDRHRNPQGPQWLYSWIRKPNRYHFRTKMPDLFLDPQKDEEGNLTDPAADIAYYLLSDNSDWKPSDIPERGNLSDEEKAALHDLAVEHLAKQYPKSRAERYLQEGILGDAAAQAKGDDIEFVGPTNDENRVAKQLAYLGRRTIAKYGCSGCHDIPGFESAKPIGTGLADWGRKNTSRLAFEQIAGFLADGGHGHGGGHGESQASPRAHGLTDSDRTDPGVAYFLDALEHHNRQGFLWQKLRQPRSFDYEKTGNKAYNERLRMPKFPFSAVEREAVMTFVLGLVSEPPAERYIFNPKPRSSAILAGKKLIQEFNCEGCHTLRMDRWDFSYHADDLGSSQATPDFPFLEPYFTPEQIAESLRTDRRGMMNAVVHGRAGVDPQTGNVRVYDEEQDPIPEEDLEDTEAVYNSFVLWRPTLINGETRDVGSPNLMVPIEGTEKYPAWGGHLANYLFPVVTADAKQLGEADKGAEAWGWVPPPLVDEGKKVQTPWLTQFLLEPTRIRPAVVLRMPKFNLSPLQAEKIAGYFDAIDNPEYPLDLEAARWSPETPEEGGQQKLDPLKKLVSSNYCVKCHLVGDFRPAGAASALAPNLGDVSERLRGDWVSRWVANPKRILPYTGMPVNIPFLPDPPHFGGIARKDFDPGAQEGQPRGTSAEQLYGLVDFLMSYREFTASQTSMTEFVDSATRAAEAAAAGGQDASVSRPSPDDQANRSLN